MPKVPQSSASFAPELIQALQIGARQRFRIKVENFPQAERLRFRLHGLRAALRRERSPLCIATDKTHIKISSKRDTEHWLEIRPADSEFADIIAQALPRNDEPEQITHSEVLTDSGLDAFASTIRDVIEKDKP